MTVPFRILNTVAVIFGVLMVTGYARAEIHMVRHSAAAVASAAAASIKAGTSLVSGLQEALAAEGYYVTVVVQVENWTRYKMLYPVARAKGGVISDPPRAILPGQRELFSARKSKYSVKGTWGTVSWELQGAHRRFVLMWSAPFSFISFSNWLGLGMTSPGHTGVAGGHEWFNQMYWSSNSDSLTFKRREYDDHNDPIIYRDDKFEVVGTMTSIHNAQIDVIIRPRLENTNDLAPDLRAALNHTANKRR